MTDGTPPPQDGLLVGQPVRRREDERILRGEATYLDDIERPRMAHIAFVRSPHAHARLRVRNELPAGALLLLTADDLDGINPLPVQEVDGVEHVGPPHPVLADGEVRYVGQPVAAVVAETRALAEDAAELVQVDYEPLEPVLSPREAPELLARFARRTSGVEAAFASAAHVVRQSFELPRLVAAPIECRGAIAEPDLGEGTLTVWVSAQDSHRQRAGLAHVLGLPDDRIRVIVPDVGGSFGSKGVVAAESCATAIAAVQLDRPVKWAEDRLENFLAAQQGRGLEADVELALDADGTFTGVRARLYADLGAYLLPTTTIPAHTAALLMTGCYTIPEAEVEIVGARTDRVPTAPYRGAGRPEAAVLVEGIVDLAARELGIDRLELRRRNLIPVDAFPYATPLGWTYDSGDYGRCLDLAVELLGEVEQSGHDALRGTGFAMYVERAGGMWESAEVTIEPTGRVVVASGSNPHGQGHATTFGQIVADQLGVDPGDVVFQFGDSAVVPRGVGTFASRSVAVGGSALVRALEAVRRRMLELAAEMLGADVEDVVRSEGGFSAAGSVLTFADVAAAAYRPGRPGPTAEIGLRAYATFSSPLVFSSGCYAATVEIDPGSGRIRIVRLVAVDDAGRIVNPLLAEGQVIGGIAQALGECLTEEAVVDESGQPRTASFADYSLLTAAEMPPIRAAFVETPTPTNPLGAKGIGEGGTIGALAAVANAVADALGGRWLAPPYTERKLWEALQAETAAGEPQPLLSRKGSGER
jgi:carbon-monoxide dehydrogenase large subunit